MKYFYYNTFDSIFTTSADFPHPDLPDTTKSPCAVARTRLSSDARVILRETNERLSASCCASCRDRMCSSASNTRSWRTIQKYFDDVITSSTASSEIKEKLKRAHYVSGCLFFDGVPQVVERSLTKLFQPRHDRFAFRHSAPSTRVPVKHLQARLTNS